MPSDSRTQLPGALTTWRTGKITASTCFFCKKSIIGFLRGVLRKAADTAVCSPAKFPLEYALKNHA